MPQVLRAALLEAPRGDQAPTALPRWVSHFVSPQAETKRTRDGAAHVLEQPLAHVPRRAAFKGCIVRAHFGRDDSHRPVDADRLPDRFLDRQRNAGVRTAPAGGRDGIRKQIPSPAWPAVG